MKFIGTQRERDALRAALSTRLHVLEKRIERLDAAGKETPARCHREELEFAKQLRNDLKDGENCVVV